MVNKSRTEAGRKDGIVLVHSSDLHIGDEETARLWGGDSTRVLAGVLEAAAAAAADVVLLAGDVFENNRVPRALVERTAALLAVAPMPVVVLPGNHDPLVPEGVWRARLLTDGTGVQVLGVTCGRVAALPSLELEIWGNPHRDYDDMVPLRAPRRRGARHQVAIAHGHYDPVPDRRRRPRPAWLIGDDEIAATGADYVALGHWNQRIRVGAGPVIACYSGSPEVARSVNVIVLGNGKPRISRQAIGASLPHNEAERQRS